VQSFALFLLHHGQARSMRVPERPMAPAKLLVNCSLRWSHLLIEYFSSDSIHVSGAWSRLLMVKIRQPSHEFTFGVGISFIPYPLVLTPVV
jgi:hypothetical protein